MQTATNLTDYEQFKALIEARGLVVKTYASKDKRHPGLRCKVLTTEAIPHGVWDNQKPSESLMEGAQSCINELDATIERINITRQRDGRPLI